jgi:hypothetical protein
MARMVFPLAEMAEPRQLFEELGVKPPRRRERQEGRKQTQ